MIKIGKKQYEEPKCPLSKNCFRNKKLLNEAESKVEKIEIEGSNKEKKYNYRYKSLRKYESSADRDLNRSLSQSKSSFLHIGRVKKVKLPKNELAL